MSIENPKSNEIKRLTSPLTFNNSKAYDSQGNIIKCSETLSDVRFMVEPKENLFNDNEVLQYAPQSKAASKIRLKRGFGSIQDVLVVHESVPWILGLFYTVLICIAVPVFYSRNVILMYIVLVLAVLPLLYLYYIFNLNRYSKDSTKKKIKKSQKTENKVSEAPVSEHTGIDSLKKYEKEIQNLKVVFDVKEGVVRDLIEKRFEPPQITYDKFITVIDSCHKLFYAQHDAAINIITLAAEDTPRVQEEINNKINILKRIINQIEDLTNELVINISSSQQSSEEVSDLLDDMENLIDSVKEY
jgi:hypothetical protein